MENRLERILQFLREINQFKEIERQIWGAQSERQESDADHSWHLGLMVILLEKEFPPGVDRMKLLKMALIHDLPEIYAGDTWAFDTSANRQLKKQREKEAAMKLFGQLPADLATEFTELFEEYEENRTIEAQLAKSLDKMQPLIANLESSGKGWKKNNLSYEKVDHYKREHMQHDKHLHELYERIMQEAKERDLFGKES